MKPIVMLLQSKTVAIIGAGPVGLTMARLLQQRGIAATVYERDKNAHARIWGGTLDLYPHSGQPAMKAAGLLEGYFARAIPMGRTIADEHGRVLLSKPPAYDTPEINRNELRTLLLNSLTGDTVIWDRKLTRLEAHEGKWLLHFDHAAESDPLPATADLVIGANGAMSSVRAYVTDATVEATGTFIIQGEVTQPEIHCAAFQRLCNNTILMSAHEGQLVVANPRNNGALSYNLIFKTPDEWGADQRLNFRNTEEVLPFLSQRFSHWGECYAELFRATTFFVGLPTRKLPVLHPWKRTRALPITLIGDAAHLMPPFAGEGVNTGLMDAQILSDNLTSEAFPTLQAAIDDYEQKMFVYAAAAQLETSRNELALRDPHFTFAAHG